MSAIYNEIDPFAAQWTRNLIAAGHVAPGVVDERSIRDLTPTDVAGPGQRHFFAGIAVWSYALRLAGVPDDADVWTGSCPCQPFSGAGKRGGFADERHLWPAWFTLIRECRPAVVFGEQVASPDGLAWFDAVHADLEGAGYAVGAADLCAAGVGAPHIRQRLFFVAYADGVEGRLPVPERQSRGENAQVIGGGEAGEQADADGNGWRGRASHQRQQARSDAPRGATRMGDSSGTRGRWNAGAVPRAQTASAFEGIGTRHLADIPISPGPANGFWGNTAWVRCRDGQARPVEPGTFPLAHGAPARVGRLRGYGNAIVSEVAATFIRAAWEAMT